MITERDRQELDVVLAALARLCVSAGELSPVMQADLELVCDIVKKRVMRLLGDRVPGVAPVAGGPRVPETSSQAGPPGKLELAA